MTAALDEPDLAELLALIRRIRRLQWRTSSLWWLLCGRARRERTQEDYRLAVNTAAAPHLHRLLDSLEAAARQEAAIIEAGGLSRDEVEQRWRKSSARLLAGLDHFIRLHGTSEEREGLQARLSGSLDADLLRRLNDFPLDDSLLNPSRPLRGYQIIAARFTLVADRGLLGDDMGLGKTVEAIAAIAHAMAAEGRTHHIVVCPAVLIDNWLREITVATRGVAAHAHREPGRDDAYRAWLHRGGILLVSYSQAHLLAERIAGDRPVIGFLVADEAHRAKHPGARQSRATRELAERAQRVLLMSGTLMENRAEEIIRLTELARPDSGRALRQRFGNGQDAYHRHMEFREALSTFYLRRTREQVLSELPPVELLDESIDVGVLARRAAYEHLRRRDYKNAQIALTTTGGTDNAKIIRLADILEESAAQNAKVLVFSEYTSVLGLARKAVHGPVFMFTGATAAGKRPQVINAFNAVEGFAVMLCQIQTGGEGLNLHHASRIVLVEPQIKPGTEIQAIGRAHRMGQTRTVSVHRLTATDGIDERIRDNSAVKADIFRRLIDRSDLADATRGALPDLGPERLIDEELSRSAFRT